MKCCISGSICGTRVRAATVATDHGAAAFTRQKNALLSLTARSTSDSGSTIGSPWVQSFAAATGDVAGGTTRGRGTRLCRFINVKARAKRPVGHEVSARGHALPSPTIADWLLFARRVSSARSVPASA